MLLMSYEHLADRPKGDLQIDEVVLFSFPEEDLVIIEWDWETIMGKVRAGRAHELSEGDTLYLKTHFGIESNAKSLNEMLLARMLDVRGRIADTAEFQKAGIIPKTIRIQHNGRIKERMSFPTFDFVALSREESWEESELYNYLAPSKFMFDIFQERKAGEYVFDRVMFWNIPNDDLDELQRVWERTALPFAKEYSSFKLLMASSTTCPSRLRAPLPMCGRTAKMHPTNCRCPMVE